MNANWRTYSVFVSSTFSDMQSERDYLKMHVFPQINDQLKKYCIKLRPIDLRWGINTLTTDEESVEEKVLRICFEEIDRSKPFFLGLLGNRYGYIPKEETIRHFQSDYHGLSITAMEISYALLKRNDISGCLFLERNENCYKEMSESTVCQFDDSVAKDAVEKKGKLDQLKIRIKNYLSKAKREDCYISYSPKWNGKQFVGLEDFGNKVKNSILREIIKYYDKEENDSPFADEQREQEEFLFLMGNRLFHREKLFSKVSDAIEKADVILIRGESGTGKSGLYTMLVDKYKERSEQYIVLYHATDTGYNGKSLFEMLKRWCYQMEVATQMYHTSVGDFDNAVVYFRQLLKKIPEGKSLLMFIDEVDEFDRSETGRYLSFIPRVSNNKWTVVCSCREETASNISTYHKKATVIDMPTLSLVEIKGIIDKHVGCDLKDDLYEENVCSLIEKDGADGKCAENPIWLSLALDYIMCLGQEDFAEASVLSKLHNDSFDKGMIDYVNKQIAKFPDNPKKLFLRYLSSLEKYYNDFPIRLCKMLSVSFDGLEEDVLAELFGDEWNLTTFASLRNYLQGYLSEQSQLRVWRLMHKIVTLDLEEQEKQELANNIASVYFKKLNNKEKVVDNILYYLIIGKNYDEGIRYIIRIGIEKRISKEICQASDVVGSSEVMSFLESCCSRGFKRQFRLMPKFVSFGAFMRATVDLSQKARYEGHYEEAIKVVDFFYGFIDQQRMLGDLKMFYYIAPATVRFDAMAQISDKDTLCVEYEKVKSYLKIKGLLSLLLVPITKKYYNWKIFKSQ